jgi:phosphoglycerate dehydrogenase-like enzyme/predicted dehydrogenase
LVKIAVIGCGQIASAAHLPVLGALRDAGEVQLVGVCDVDAQKAAGAAARFGVGRHGADWRRVVEECGAEAVSVCLPPGPNVEVSAAALEAGLHVICEKPPGRNLRQAERLAAAAAAARPDQVSLVAFNRRFAPLYERAMKNSLRLGPPHAFYGRFTRATAPQPSNTAGDWITSDGSHALDLSIATIGFPDRVTVARKTVGAGPANVWTIQLHSPQGSALLLFDFSAVKTAKERRVERFEWTGPGYEVLLELPDRAEWTQQGEGTTSWAASELTGTDDFFTNYGFSGEYQAFVRAIKNQAGRAARPQPDFLYAASFMRLVETILSCPNGETQDVRGEPEAAVERGAPDPTAPARAATAAHAAPERPVALILQTPEAQAKCYKMDDLSRLAEQCELHLAKQGASLDEQLERADVIVTGWRSTVPTPAQLERARRLKLIVLIGVSVRALGPEALLERGVLVYNTADAIGQSVAEHALALTLAGLRRLSEFDRRMRRGEWPPQPPPPPQAYTNLRSVMGLKVLQPLKPILRPAKPYLRPAAQRLGLAYKAPAAAANGGTPGFSRHDLRGQAVGLIGWGNIARRFAELLRPFGCELLINSGHVTEDELSSVGARRASLGEVLSSSKVVSLHKGLTDETRNLLGAQELALLRPGGVLVNTARAELVDEAALLARVGRGDIVAALDVFHEEPLPAGHALRRLDNVVLSPHNANHTPECYFRSGRQACDIVFDWLAGRPAPSIDAAQLANMT